MKTKLVAILMILLFSGIFTACTEEEITPNDAAAKQKHNLSAQNDVDDF